MASMARRSQRGSARTPAAEPAEPARPPLDDQAHLGRPPRSAFDPRLLRHGDRRAGSASGSTGASQPSSSSRARRRRIGSTGCRASRARRRGAHCARRAPRPSAGADRRSARPHARLPPARDPSEPPARLPCRANAGRAPELDARHRPRRPTPALASVERGMERWFFSARRHVPRGCSRRCGGIVPASCSRTCSPRARCRSSPRRVACGYRWLRTWPAGTTRSGRA